MDLQIAYISPRQGLKSGGAQVLVEEYLRRSQRFAKVVLTGYRSEATLLETATRRASRSAPVLVLLDSRGRGLSSPQIAEYLRTQRDAGAQEMILAIGPPDGWSATAREQARMMLSLGAITLPHELALAVLSEQVYRALTILAGHPYHAAHE